MSVQYLAKEPRGRPAVTPCLHQDVEDVAVLVHGPPQVLSLTAERYEDFIQIPVPTENLIRTVRVTDRADVGPANDGNVSIADVHSVNVDEWLASFGRSSGRRAACTVFRRRPSMAVVRPRDDGSCGAGRPRAASP